MKDLWKIKEALIQFLEMAPETREALLLDTVYQVKVTKRKRTNRRRKTANANQKKQAADRIHGNLADLLALFDIEAQTGFVYVTETGREPIKDKGGYLAITIRGKTYGVHRLVWMQENQLFIPKGWEIHHRNKKRQDNRIENLELVETKRHRSSHAPK